MSSQTGIPRTIDPHGNVFDVLELLYGITRCIIKSPTKNCERIKLANSIYLAEHMLCRMNSSPVSSVEPKCLDISAPLAAAAHLFLHLGVRNIPSNARRHRHLSKRLHISLPYDLDYESLLHAPRAGIRLLLWVCAIGTVVENDVEIHDLRLAQVTQLCMLLEVRSYEEFKNYLKEVLWIDPFSSEHMARLWRTIQASFLQPGPSTWENDIPGWESVNDVDDDR
jgi:hypothetical protein